MTFKVSHVKILSDGASALGHPPVACSVSWHPWLLIGTKDSSQLWAQVVLKAS